jgi:hypothetical protein
VPRAAPTLSFLHADERPGWVKRDDHGANFTGATAVAFNGTSASFAVNSATQITATAERRDRRPDPRDGTLRHERKWQAVPCHHRWLGEGKARVGRSEPGSRSRLAVPGSPRLRWLDKHLGVRELRFPSSNSSLFSERNRSGTWRALLVVLAMT